MNAMLDDPMGYAPAGRSSNASSRSPSPSVVSMTARVPPPSAASSTVVSSTTTSPPSGDTRRRMYLTVCFLYCLFILSLANIRQIDENDGAGYRHWFVITRGKGKIGVFKTWWVQYVVHCGVDWIWTGFSGSALHRTAAVSLAHITKNMTPDTELSKPFTKLRMTGWRDFCNRQMVLVNMVVQHDLFFLFFLADNISEICICLVLPCRSGRMPWIDNMIYHLLCSDRSELYDEMVFTMPVGHLGWMLPKNWLNTCQLLALKLRVPIKEVNRKIICHMIWFTTGKGKIWLGCML